MEIHISKLNETLKKFDTWGHFGLHLQIPTLLLGIPWERVWCDVVCGGVGGVKVEKHCQLRLVLISLWDYLGLGQGMC